MTPHAAAPLRDTAADRSVAISRLKDAPKHVPPQEEATNQPWWSRRRKFIAAALVLLLVLAGLAIGRFIIRNNYYVAETNGMVSIVRGIQGSLLGMSLDETYLIGCLNANNGLSLISPSQTGGALDCSPMQLQDLVPAARAQVQAGLPGGSLDDAINQLHDLAAKSLRPLCPPSRATSPATTTAPTTVTTPGTVTALPPPPPEPGIDCRAAA
jgi:protein phosphatase